MAIVGITVSATGEEIQSLAVGTKVSIGEVVQTKNGTRPNKLDHFAFLKKSATTNDWESDPELTKHYGKECRDLPIILLNDNIERVFRTEYAWWTSTEKKCYGDGLNAFRRDANGVFQPWKGCGDGCPDLDRPKACDPSGDLYFVLADFPKLGTMCRIHTKSYQSIRQLWGSLVQIRGMCSLAGRKLTGTRCILTVRPSRTSYTDTNGVKHNTTIFVLNIELPATGVKRLIADMQTPQHVNGLLADAPVEYVAAEEDETAKAAEIAREWTEPEPEPAPAPAPKQPQRVQQPAAPTNGPVTPEVLPPATNGVPRAVIPPAGAPAAITKVQRKKFYDACVEAGWGTQQVSDILLEKWNVKSSAEIPADKFEEIYRYFESGGFTPPSGETDEDIPY
jgi:hypothetical protein